MQDLLPFMERGPQEHHVLLPHKRPRESNEASKRKEEKEELPPAATSPAIEKEIEKIVYPSLPEEPKEKRELLCRVGIRLPDGRRIQRNFLLTDPIQVGIYWPCFYAGNPNVRVFVASLVLLRV